jgi:subtilisin family serine protease
MLRPDCRDKALVMVVGVALTIGARAHAAGERAEFHRVVGGKEVPLRLDPTRIAVLREGASRLARGLPGLGVAAAAEETHPIPGWTLARLPEAGADRGAGPGAGVQAAADIRALVELQSQDPTVSFVSPVFIDDLGGPMFVTPGIVVGMNPGVDPERAAALLRGAGAVIERDWQNMRGTYLVHPSSRSGANVLDIASAMARLPEVAWAEPDFVFTGRGLITPNDPGYPNCWGINNTAQLGGVVDQDMDGPEAWDITTGGPSIVTLIIDTGVDSAHPDINQVVGVDNTSDGASGQGAPINSFDNHGTAVAGCVSATINNSLGTVGIAPTTRIASARTFISINSSGNWTSQASWTVAALAFGESIGARVTNNSNAYGFSSVTIENKYIQTRDAGMVHFASAGNDSSSSAISYPAILGSVNSVAALTPAGLRASFSNAGDQQFIAAPGTSIYSTDRVGNDGYNSTGDYAFVQGTSFASPYAAGVAALVLSVNPMLSAQDVETLLATTAVDRGESGWDPVYGWGFVNARAALEATAPQGPPGPFVLGAPAAGASQVSRTPVLSWTTASTASGYRLILDDDADLSSPLLDTPVTGTSLTIGSVAPLMPATTYSWSVVASNMLGSTASSPVVSSFTTISLPPATPWLSSPAAGATGVPTTPSLAWIAADRAESYTVRVDNNPDFSSPEFQLTTTSLSAVPAVPLAGQVTYSWNVTASNPLGSTVSATRTFTTVGAAPGSFNLLSPSDGLNIATRTPTLSWSASTGAATYTVTIDDQQDLSSPVIVATGVSQSQYTVPADLLLDLTRYYWRVSAVNGFGSVVGSPPLYSFAVVIPPCPGDADGNRTINFLDISSVLSNFGNTGAVGIPGDANRDGVVNLVDITAVLAAFGTTCPG